MLAIQNLNMKEVMSNEMIKKNKQIKKRNLQMQKNIDEVIKYFELNDNVRIFLEKAISKQKKYSPRLIEKAKNIVEKEINKILQSEKINKLIENGIVLMVEKIAYKEFIKEKERLKQEFYEKILEL